MNKTYYELGSSNKASMELHSLITVDYFFSPLFFIFFLENAVQSSFVFCPYGFHYFITGNGLTSVKSRNKEELIRIELKLLIDWL